MPKKVLIILTILSLFGSVALARVTTERRDFWFGFRQIADAAQPSSFKVFITSNEPARGTITSFAGGPSIDFEVTQGTACKRVLSFANDNSLAGVCSGLILERAIYITSDVNISVYGTMNGQGCP